MHIKELFVILYIALKNTTIQEQYTPANLNKHQRWSAKTNNYLLRSLYTDHALVTLSVKFNNFLSRSFLQMHQYFSTRLIKHQLKFTGLHFCADVKIRLTNDVLETRFVVSVTSLYIYAFDNLIAILNYNLLT